MDSLYRFSPIKTEEQLRDAIFYVAQKTEELSSKITGAKYPISSLTIFSHYPEEFEYLKQALGSMGEQIGENNGPFVKLNDPITLEQGALEKVRVRHPDPYRAQVGCNDFVIPRYGDFKNQYLPANPNNLRVISRPEYEMIEFFDPDFDVLAYVVNKNLV